MQTAHLESLRRFVARPHAGPMCDLCGAPILDEHDHVLETRSSRVMCTCGACAVLFDGGTSGRARIPRRVRRLDRFQLSAAQWDLLGLPINLAYFVDSSVHGHVVAYYPSPAGATESLLAMDRWDEIVLDNPILARLERDVEALLVNRIGEPDAFIVPIDRCYALVGLIRSRWSGLSGGTEVWRAIAEFFSDLERRA